jgi:hypothetical protein
VDGRNEDYEPSHRSGKIRCASRLKSSCGPSNGNGGDGNINDGDDEVGAIMVAAIGTNTESKTRSE